MKAMSTKRKFLAALVITVPLCFTPLVIAQSSNDSVTAQDVKEETRQFINTLGEYSAGQRDQALKEANQALEKLDVRIDKLETRIDENWDSMTQAARQETRANLKVLRKQRNELSEWYGSLKYSSADAWDHLKEGFSNAYQSINDAWENAKSEFDSNDE